MLGMAYHEPSQTLLVGVSSGMLAFVEVLEDTKGSCAAAEHTPMVLGPTAAAHASIERGLVMSVMPTPDQDVFTFASTKEFVREPRTGIDVPRLAEWPSRE